MKKKWIYNILLLGLAFASCADSGNEEDFPGNDGRIHLSATLAKSHALTRATEPAPDGDYYLHYTAVGGTALSSNKYSLSSSTWTANPALYWDDIKKASPESSTAFHLSNRKEMTFPSKVVNRDILLGTTTGWNEPLNFTLNHLTAKVSVVIFDNTLNKDVDFKNAKVVFNPGLNKTTTGIDHANKKILYDSADKEKSTTISTANFTPSANITVESVDYNGVISDPLYIVTHEFKEADILEVTAGKYVYRIPVPLPTAESYPYTLGSGEHLTIYVELTEHTAKFTATLVDWIPETPNNIEVSRVFNIATWQELSDLEQAIATGYTFKGMVVRLMADIKLEGQISLGTEKYPFEGIFDGNGKTIRDLGKKDQQNLITPNTGGLFGYTRGATLQNITLESPYVESGGKTPVGALVNVANNTTLFNCKTFSANQDAGQVKGNGDKTGGLVGAATGSSTLINCRSYVRVQGSGEYVGGLIGYSEASLTQCMAAGEVDSPKASYIGGLAGYMNGTLQYGFARGDVTGASQVGGLIGYLDGEASQCYASGQVSGSKDVGGLVGNLGFSGVAKSCFWHSQNTSGSGSASLDGTCKSYTTGSQLLSSGYLDNSTLVWMPDTDGYPTFAN